MGNCTRSIARRLWQRFGTLTIPTPEKDLEFFLAKFNELADDAREHGLSVVILIENADPLSKKSSISKVFRGTIATSVGLLQLALMDFQQRQQP